MRIASVDLVSNTCFPAIAAEELGFFRGEGVDAHVELFPQLKATKALRDGRADAMIAGTVFDLLTEFPRWEGVKLLMALSQGTPHLLVVRSDLQAKRGDVNALKGLRIAAAHGPDLLFKRLLVDAGIDRERDGIEIVHPPGTDGPKVSFGVFAAEALASRQVDGFWANAMGSETAVTRGIGKILLDVRRGDDPAEVRHFTFAGLATTDDFIARDPKSIEAAVRAIVKTQRALRNEPGLAEEVGRRRFPPEAASLIRTLVERDSPFYDPVISEDSVVKLNSFSESVGLLPGPVSYEQVVAVRFKHLWSAAYD